ncbi:HAD family phosphatase [bacterium]|nr:HAD family phosphatase [bacterium]MBU1637720.1 HAD family phosphatase [bacterium]MBU1921039.1 HAD family phosphatase [bacterium]
MSTRAVFFDFDGTLIDSMPAHVSAWSEILKGIGIDLEDKYFEMHEGEKAEDTIDTLLRENGIEMSDAERDELIDRKRALYRSRAPKGLIPEARALVNALRERDIFCDIVTGSVKRNMTAVLSDEELALFRNIITPDDYQRGKPQPDPYLTALKASGLVPGACLVLENAPLGIRSAKAAGLYTLAITTTLPPYVLNDADRIISSFQELIDSIKP